MSWRPTSTVMLAARSLGRKLGVNRWISSLLRGNDYEGRYDERLSGLLQPGDCVWDVGANVGYYTKTFARRVGQKGHVYAFEPSPKNYERLVDSCSGLTNVTPVRSAVGYRDGEVLTLIQGEDDLGATSRIGAAQSGQGAEVTVRSGDGMVADNLASPPNIIKIDVEGFEWEVLQGMPQVLANRSLRAIGIEIHFGILSKRGLKSAPKQIEDLLRRVGFEVEWPDMSHVVAQRIGQ